MQKGLNLTLLAAGCLLLFSQVLIFVFLNNTWAADMPSSYFQAAILPVLFLAACVADRHGGVRIPWTVIQERSCEGFRQRRRRHFLWRQRAGHAGLPVHQGTETRVAYPSNPYHLHIRVS